MGAKMTNDFSISDLEAMPVIERDGLHTLRFDDERERWWISTNRDGQRAIVVEVWCGDGWVDAWAELVD